MSHPLREHFRVINNMSADALVIFDKFSSLEQTRSSILIEMLTAIENEAAKIRRGLSKPTDDGAATPSPSPAPQGVPTTGAGTSTGTPPRKGVHPIAFAARHAQEIQAFTGRPASLLGPEEIVAYASLTGRAAEIDLAAKSPICLTCLPNVHVVKDRAKPIDGLGGLRSGQVARDFLRRAFWPSGTTMEDVVGAANALGADRFANQGEEAPTVTMFRVKSEDVGELLERLTNFRAKTGDLSEIIERISGKQSDEKPRAEHEERLGRRGMGPQEDRRVGVLPERVLAFTHQEIEARVPAIVNAFRDPTLFAVFAEDVSNAMGALIETHVARLGRMPAALTEKRLHRLVIDYAIARIALLSPILGIEGSELMDVVISELDEFFSA